MSRLLHSAVQVLLCAICLALGIRDAVADRRVALVIGNSKYKDAKLTLANPASDAEDIAASLRKLSFDVVLMINATIDEADKALRQFGDVAETADTALFFYAGHALQYQGNNYLMPIDALLEDEVHLRRYTVTDEDVRKALDRSRGVKIMILDACRTNPLSVQFRNSLRGPTRAFESMTRGLARIDMTQGTVIAYAAAPGDVALDGKSGRNSPFTTALLKWMDQPALEIKTMLTRVTNEVLNQTGNQQRPEYSSTLRNDYFLDPLADRRKWERIRDLNDAAELRDFINTFPYSIHVFDAQRRLEIIERGRREREDQARIERERIEADRLLREREELARLDRERIEADRVRREREEARRREEQQRLAAERCRNEQAQVEVLSNDLAGLQEFVQRAGCEQARALAHDRIKAVAAQRAEEQRQRQEAESICRDEQQKQASIGNDVPRLQAFLQQATCAPVRAAVAEHIRTVTAQRDRAETEARQQEARNCQAELAAMTPIWNDLPKLQELDRKASCVDVRSRLAARIGELLAAQRQAQLLQQQAAEKLAALEEEQNRLRREEEQRQRAERERQQAATRCENERVELASIEAELKKLQDFVKRSGCEEVRTLTTAKITQIEREEKVCKDEDARRNRLLEQARRQSDRTRLASLKQDMIKFELEMSCARLHPSVAEALGMIRVKAAQIELKRLGCFTGSGNGILNDATRDAAKNVLAKLGRPDGDGAIDEELLSQLNAPANAAICKLVQPPVIGQPTEEPPRRKASIPPRQERPAPRRERNDSSPRATQRAEPRPQAAPPHQSAPPAARPSGGASSVMGL
jgi:uncharacterized caspase-like protein